VVENAIKTPVSALFPVGARSGLFVLDNVMHAYKRSRWQHATVSTHGSSRDKQGHPVIVYPDTKLKDGDRVKARQIPTP